jgi:hypothetical protein
MVFNATFNNISGILWWSVVTADFTAFQYRKHKNTTKLDIHIFFLFGNLTITDIKLMT